MTADGVPPELHHRPRLGPRLTAARGPAAWLDLDRLQEELEDRRQRYAARDSARYFLNAYRPTPPPDRRGTMARRYNFGGDPLPAALTQAPATDSHPTGHWHHDHLGQVDPPPRSRPRRWAYLGPGDMADLGRWTPEPRDIPGLVFMDTEPGGTKLFPSADATEPYRCGCGSEYAVEVDTTTGEAWCALHQSERPPAAAPRRRRWRWFGWFR